MSAAAAGSPCFVGGETAEPFRASTRRTSSIRRHMRRLQSTPTDLVDGSHAARPGTRSSASSSGPPPTNGLHARETSDASAREFDADLPPRRTTASTSTKTCARLRPPPSRVKSTLAQVTGRRHTRPNSRRGCRSRKAVRVTIDWEGGAAAPYSSGRRQQRRRRTMRALAPLFNLGIRPLAPSAPTAPRARLVIGAVECMAYS